jgi:Tol biopolymer transport system component
VVDGLRYAAAAAWPDDEIAGYEPSVPLRFIPDLPALPSSRISSATQPYGGEGKSPPSQNAVHSWLRTGGGVSEEPTGEAWNQSDEPPVRRRVFAALLGVVVAGSGGLVAVRTILDSGIRPPPQSQESSSENGAIVYLGKGPPGGLGVDNTDLLAVDPATGRRWNLTGTRGAAERDPILSPDGTRVVFFRSSIEQLSDQELGSHDGLYLMNIDGSGTREIRPCNEFCAFGEVTWSADGSRLAFVDRLSDSVHVMDPDGAHEFDLCTTKPRWRRCGQGVSEPAWSPDGRWIAYAENAPSIGIGPSPSSIFLAAVDGSAVRRLTGRGCLEEATPCFHDVRPEWSEDGTKIAFSRYPVWSPGNRTQEEPAAYTVDVATGRLRRTATCIEACSLPLWPRTEPWASPVAEGPAIRVAGPGLEAREVRTCDAEGCVEPEEALISPDGRAAAFISRWPERDLFAIDIAGRAMRRLADDVIEILWWLPRSVLAEPSAASEVNAASRAPSPQALPHPPADGMIAFVGDPTENSWWNLYVVRADGSGFLQLTHRPSISNPSWSADGERIFFSRVDDYGKEGVYSIRPDGTDERLLAPVHGTISPDGTRVAFMEEGSDGMDRIWVMNLDGSGRRALTDPPLRNENFSPVWSPDGSLVLYESYEKEGSDLHIVDGDGGDQRRLTDLPGSERQAVWSPDGTHIAFSWSTDAGTDTYVVNADGTGLRRLADFPIHSPAWSPDGSAVGFVAGPLFPNQRTANYGGWIYAMPLEGGAVFTVFDGADLSPMNLAWGTPSSP